MFNKYFDKYMFIVKMGFSSIRKAVAFYASKEFALIKIPLPDKYSNKTFLISLSILNALVCLNI